MNHMTGICLPLSDPRFTPKQGQYLAFIYAYTQVLGRPPAEADLQRHFRVSPPSVHQMVLTLERAGLIRRTVGGPRSIEILWTLKRCQSYAPPKNNPSNPLCSGTSEIAFIEKFIRPMDLSGASEDD
jgi:SOS-response transcriptional repressor LexA